MNKKLLTGVGLGGLLSINGLTYQITNVQDVSLTYTIETDKQVIIESVAKTSGVIDYNENYYYLIDLDNPHNYIVDDITINNIAYDIELIDDDEDIYGIMFTGDIGNPLENENTDIENIDIINRISINGVQKIIDKSFTYFERSSISKELVDTINELHQNEIDELNEVHNAIIEDMTLNDTELEELTDLYSIIQAKIDNGDIIELVDYIEFYEIYINEKEESFTDEIISITSRYDLKRDELQSKIDEKNNLLEEKEQILEELEWEKKNIFQKIGHFTMLVLDFFVFWSDIYE